MNFAAPYDTTTKVVSAFVCLLLLGAGMATHSLIVGTLSVALLLIAYAYSTLGYGISGGALVIRRLAGEVRMPLLELREVRPATKDDLRECVRLMGSGGFFGYYGLFRTARLGKCSWYVTDRSRMIVARFGTKTILLSPLDVPGFLETIRTFAPPPDKAPSIAQAPEARPSSRAWKLIGVAIAFAVAGVGVTLGILANSYAPGPPRYTLTRDALTIHDRYYPVSLKAGHVDIEHIRVVDLASDTDWRPVRRTNGFANAHYQSGWFRAANGQSMRMYSAGGRQLVLLPPKGGGPPVLMQTEDPERFVDELRQKWQGHS